MKNIGASVRARLLNIARDQNQTFNFVLKGATLLMTSFDESFRGTQDLDLLGYGDPDPDAVLDLFREILATLFSAKLRTNRGHHVTTIRKIRI